MRLSVHAWPGEGNPGRNASSLPPSSFRHFFPGDGLEQGRVGRDRADEYSSRFIDGSAGRWIGIGIG